MVCPHDILLCNALILFAFSISQFLAGEMVFGMGVMMLASTAGWGAAWSGLPHKCVLYFACHCVLFVSGNVIVVLL
jgi:hypothetical protein